jgi:hypothetical protein
LSEERFLSSLAITLAIEEVTGSRDRGRAQVRATCPVFKTIGATDRTSALVQNFFKISTTDERRIG